MIALSPANHNGYLRTDPGRTETGTGAPQLNVAPSPAILLYTLCPAGEPEGPETGIGAPQHNVAPSPAILLYTLCPAGDPGRTETGTGAPQLIVLSFLFYTLLSQWEFLPWETRVAFPKKNLLQQSRVTQP